jgi:2-Cys peroxiredoxin 5
MRRLQVPGLKKAEIDGRLEEAGIDMVYVFCVNDGAVMTAWKKDQGLAGSDIIEFLADSHAELTEALGLVLTEAPGGEQTKPYDKYSGPNNALGNHTKRCKRSAMFVVDGVLKVFQIAEAEDDPAGDDRPEVSCIENMLTLIKAL